MLREVTPALSRTVGEVTVVGAVQMRVNELMRTTGQCQHGLVLIGDAFQTSCPAAGTGIGRLLNDVERLCHVHIPRWLATEGMGVEKIRQFYADR
jgi:2-polyprenyl-6-methoxyphenol hydroxylase-like FAD-dependent oxidoreductase